jgi:acyl-CoA hydrolase
MELTSQTIPGDWLERQCRCHQQRNSIDLTGQVDADWIGSHLYSGIGGQADFIRGAARRCSGRPIIAIRTSCA